MKKMLWSITVLQLKPSSLVRLSLHLAVWLGHAMSSPWNSVSLFVSDELSSSSTLGCRKH